MGERFQGARVDDEEPAEVEEGPGLVRRKTLAPGREGSGAAGAASSGRTSSGAARHLPLKGKAFGWRGDAGFGSDINVVRKEVDCL